VSDDCKLVVVAPTKITEIAASNVPETDYPEWVAGTYAKGQRVIVLSAHRVYESAADGNTDNPLTPTAEPKWLRVGPTNRWKAFDESISTQTAQADSITYTLTPGEPVSRLTFLNLTDAESIRVQITDPLFPGEEYDRTITLGRQLQRSSWWNYFYGRRDVPTQADFDDLPGFRNPTINITITGGAALAVGVILPGVSQAWGLSVRNGARIGIQDYSRKGVDDFGNTQIVKRNFARRMNATLVVPAGEVDSLYNFMANVRAEACLWIATNAFESTTIYGYYWNFEFLLAYGNFAEFELELRGIT
jgi:hypothetical protein